MEIKVLGPGCAKCNRTEEIIRQVLVEEGIDAHVEKVADLKEITALGVMLTPSVIIDGTVKCSGRVPQKREIRAWIAD
jgi:small redox-active disulfide protein 2